MSCFCNLSDNRLIILGSLKGCVFCYTASIRFVFCYAASIRFFELACRKLPSSNRAHNFVNGILRTCGTAEFVTNNNKINNSSFYNYLIPIQVAAKWYQYCCLVAWFNFAAYSRWIQWYISGSNYVEQQIAVRPSTLETSGVPLTELNPGQLVPLDYM